MDGGQCARTDDVEYYFARAPRQRSGCGGTAAVRRVLSAYLDGPQRIRGRVAA